MDIDVLKNIIVGDFTLLGGFVSYKSMNVLEPQGDIQKLGNGEYNVAVLDTLLRPKLDVTFRYVDIEDYRKFVRQVNRPFFEAEYYDFELGKRVIRTMRMSVFDLERLVGQFTDIFSVEGMSVSFESIYGYLNYEDLEGDVHQ